MARDNYSFQKHKKELAKKKKKEEKRQRKLDRKNIESKEDEAQAADENLGPVPPNILLHQKLRLAICNF